MPTTVQAAAAAVAVFLPFAACLLTHWPNQRAVEIVAALSFPLMSLVFVPLGGLVAASARGQSKAAWVALTIALISWAAAEAIWAYYEIADDRTPFPSPADAVYMLYLPAMTVALLLFPSGRSWRGQSRVVLDGAILTGSFFLISWLAVLRTLWNTGVNSKFDFALSLTYPAGDFLVLALGFLVLLRVAPGLRLTLALAVVAFACDAIADSLWV